MISSDTNPPEAMTLLTSLPIDVSSEISLRSKSPVEM
jgi:hypothetical protein